MVADGTGVALLSLSLSLVSSSDSANREIVHRTLVVFYPRKCVVVAGSSRALN